jgi:hypothetical protein
MRKNAELVRRTIIDPMQRLYGGAPLNEYQIETFVDDLGGYSPVLLESAWKLVRRTCKSRPNVAHFIAAIEEIKPPTPSGGVSRKPEHHCQHNAELADRVMRSEVGQLALREGVGQGVWMAAWRDGRADLTAQDVHRMKRAWLDGVGRMAEFKNTDTALYRQLESLHHAIAEKERELARKYTSARTEQADRG